MSNKIEEARNKKIESLSAQLDCLSSIGSIKFDLSRQILSYEISKLQIDRANLVSEVAEIKTRTEHTESEGEVNQFCFERMRLVELIDIKIDTIRELDYESR